MAVNWRVYLKSIKGSQYFKVIQPILKGSTQDKKFYIETVQGHQLLLKIAPIKDKRKKFKEFESLKYLEKMKISVNSPITFGEFNFGREIYTIYRWLEGTSCREYLDAASEKRQYLFGEKAGKVLRRVHKLKVAENMDKWCENNVKYLEKLCDKYKELPEKSEMILGQLEGVMEHGRSYRPKKIVLCHGDYHVGNLIVTLLGEVGVIDMDRSVVADTYYDFPILLKFLPSSGTPFANGQIMGYFEDKPPKSFFESLKYGVITQIMSQALRKNSKKANATDIYEADKNFELYCEMYDNFTLDVPKWYSGKIFEDSEIEEKEEVGEELLTDKSMTIDGREENADDENFESVEETTEESEQK